jgi:hypothetical protein
MTDFLKDYYFNGFCEGRKNFVSTPRYANKLRAMRIAQSHERGVLFKVLFATPRYATQCEIQVKNFLVDSALCGTAESTVLAHESEDPGVQFNEKTEGRKSCENCPFKKESCSYL